MQEKELQKILIVDDVTENIKILIELLKNDYVTFFAKNGKTALEIAKTKKPDLILLDIIMPEMDGYEVCQKLKSNETTHDIPVIFISAMNEVGDETKGLEIGAVDYIIKPISPPIVKARVKNHLKLRSAMQELKRLYSMALDSNPMTGLPGNNSIARRIEKALNEMENLGVIYSDLDNFKAFNDKYGFALGDKVILFTAKVLEKAISSANISDPFIGHIGGDDFVVIVPSDKIETVSSEIARIFDEGVIQFYTPEDACSKYICSINRQGEKETFPLMSISMAGVDLSHNYYKQYIQVNDALAMIKKKSKAVPGSSFIMDRRVGNN
ncbi:MAG: response regulator [Desulfobacterales bacterium]|nr:response regulator [Desulfobacterales bacterium]